METNSTFSRYMVKPFHYAQTHIESFFLFFCMPFPYLCSYVKYVLSFRQMSCLHYCYAFFSPITGCLITRKRRSTSSRLPYYYALARVGVFLVYLFLCLFTFSCKNAKSVQDEVQLHVAYLV